MSWKVTVEILIIKLYILVNCSWTASRASVILARADSTELKEGLEQYSIILYNVPDLGGEGGFLLLSAGDRGGADLCGNDGDLTAGGGLGYDESHCKYYIE